jgi:5-methylcytosine-specific restriction enzyme A
MTRRSFSKKERVTIFEAAQGCCHICGGKIGANEAWEIEHVRPLSMGGANDPDNLAPAHVKCHAGKTAAEAGPRARADRLRDKRMGFKPKPSSRPLAGTIASGFKRRFDGTVEKR